jgi:uncharacterized flavoprotein (TIGR03862 family)
MTIPSPAPTPTPARAAVIGGGPSGLMAAEVLARAGVHVTVFERMPTVGRKLQVAGRGGLNLTHSEPLDAFLARYGTARPRLEAAVEAFAPADLRAWAEELGEPTFVGTSGRVFPVGFRATSLLRRWLARLAELGVEVRTRHVWTGWEDDGRLLLRDASGELVTAEADVCVLALGGASWPRTGSDGAWVPLLAAVGVDVTALQPANCGFVVAWSDVVRERFAGTPLKDVALRHGDVTARGDLVITRDGVEGGPVYALSRALRTALDSAADTTLHVDLFPDATSAEVTERLGRRRAKDSTTNGLRRAGVPPAGVALLREVTANVVPTDATALAELLKALPLRLTATRPTERAISTAGGVALGGVDERFMLRARPGTFVAGEMLDWEAPTGGYLLQGAFSTGAAAAAGALAWLARDQPAGDTRSLDP